LTCFCLLCSPAFSFDRAATTAATITSTTTTTTSGDHLLIIGGLDYFSSGIPPSEILSDVKVLTFDANDDECKMPDLDEAVYHHASVVSSRGVITCGGTKKHAEKLSKCIIQHNEKTSSFPSMVWKRTSFGMLNVNETLYSVGGFYDWNHWKPHGPHTTMETIDLNYDREWSLRKLDFDVANHCMVNIGSMIYVVGGYSVYEEATIDRVMIYDINNKKWTEGPSLNIKRRQHACMVDPKTGTIHVMGGNDSKNSNIFNSTETLKKGSKKWEMGPNLKQSVMRSAAVSSRSVEYVGYLVGGLTFDGLSHQANKTWGLRRRDMEWVEMSKQLKIPRMYPSVVNVQLGEIGC